MCACVRVRVHVEVVIYSWVMLGEHVRPFGVSLTRSFGTNHAIQWLLDARTLTSCWECAV